MVDFAALSKRSAVLRAAIAGALALVAACGGAQRAATLPPAESLDAVLAPASLVASLRQAGGGHFHATTLLQVDAPATASDAGQPAAPSAVATTTDLWMDGAGNFRLVENNDRDGGREVVRVGSEIAVGLRYGKLVRRAAQDAESNRILAEAVGGPWTAWELVRRQVEVAADGATYRFKLVKPGERKSVPLPGSPPAEGLRKWRDSVVIKALEGGATLDSGRSLPLTMACKAGFEASRDQLAVTGEVAVAATLDQVGKVAKVEMPDADSLRTRQRTVLEERALLGGITAAAARGEKAGP
jgi:hypothetical protein